MANSNFTCVLDAWNDGKVLYGRMHYYRSGSYYYQDSTFPDPTMNLGGVTYTDSSFGARVRSGIYVGDVYTTTFSRTVGGSGNRTVTFSAGSGQRSDFAGTWSKNVTIPESYSAPTGLNVTIAEIYPTGAKFNVSISSYGNPSSASGRWIEAGIAGQNAWTSPSLRSAIVQNSTSAQITVDNNSTKTTTLTVQPNTQYYYGGYAYNTQKSTSLVKGQFVTTAEAPTVTLGSVTSNSATFNYSAAADGGYYDKTIEYSTDGGATWQTGATITGGSAASGSFTVSNLLSGAEYMLMVRTTTTSGSTAGTSIPFQTEAIIQHDKCVYGGVSGTGAKQIIDLYGGSNSGAKRITKLYGSAGEAIVDASGTIRSGGAGNLNAFNKNNFLANTVPVLSSNAIDYLKVVTIADPFQATLSAHFTDNTAPQTLYTATTVSGLYHIAQYGAVMKNSGFIDGDDYIDISPTISSQTKLIHQGFGHLTYT